MTQLYVTLALAGEWAHAQLGESIARLTTEQWERSSAVNFRSMQGIANHLLLADRLWLHRITGQGERPGDVSSIPYPDIAGYRAARRAQDAAIVAFARSVDAARLDDTLAFSTLGGTARALPLGLCLMHFFNHQTHHRGQLHGLLGTHGIPAPDIDLLYFPGAQAAWSA